MRFDVVTLFPEMFQSMLGHGVTGRAFERGLAELVLWNPRDYARDVHRTVDDRPYGGGPGMVMKPESLLAAVEDAKAEVPASMVAYLSPQGRVFNQRVAGKMAERQGVILIAGRYEGIDERVVSRCVDEEWSIGDYVLSGGELPALVLIDTVVRLLPGVLGDEDSAQQDSYMDGLLDCPHYTRPEIFDGEAVPPVLLSGDHEAIRRWRLQQSLGRTWLRRPELLQDRGLSAEEQILLDEFIRAQADAG
ncbi:MAG: tRNA (guanosine(37)-N1)-methyltransferase TrmD [Chromatiaceae bacterium]|nr:tRNA (guanosine(37)-N1)-methyltransferase TrmD [Gammaproteobacteria bacterium]MCP5427266.1 tRNA (guanosine(37)-N1)-methyltransferase TrmD [Chromatiaceae bacterium]MCB1860839.1 tRNA (guanosine(37)-N1)-methyltransferase TrmD [Gammaproteobacteria bacterium]MCB1872224.1 tRNA (guanosine(37)-N1)-methyltransferase TrmD [Gammaproteobacteria bacterium]MCB1879683.1 tRNA (guanosine(37)-N1)-methyltransferase TrmD [Gammaproteobacteria bacterium]